MENNLGNNSPTPPEPIQPVPINSLATKKWYQHKGIIAVIVLGILAAGVCWAYFNYGQPQNVQPVAINHKPTNTLNTTSATTTPSNATSTEPITATSTPTNEDNGYIPTNLKKLSDLHLVKYREGDPSAQFYYYEVENITVNGAKLILAQDTYCDGEGCAPGYYRFLPSGNSYALLTKYSAPVDGSNGLSASDLTTSKTSTIDIPQLDIPTQLQDPKTNAVVKLDSYSFTAGDFFNPQDRTLVFSANGYDVFTANSGAQSETYYVKAADGKDLTYELSDPFLDNQTGGFTSTLNIQWNDGKTHNNSFRLDPSGDNSFGDCEVGDNYAKVARQTTITQNDLLPVGTNNNGQTIYTLKDPNHPLLVAARAAIKTLGKNVSDNATDIIVFWQDPFGRLLRFVTNDMMDFCGGKPVIYLYPTQPTQVNVQVNPIGGISKSEPLYNGGWNVFAQPDGTIFSNGQQYPYLFWEGGLGSYQTPNTGFVVEKQQIKELLNTKLSYIGLNSKEIYDFEQFWVPRMQSSPYYFVTFTVNTDMEKYAPLAVTPKPDTIIRVLMDYKPLSQYQTVEPLQLPHTERKGFTVVEWGGTLK